MLPLRTTALSGWGRRPLESCQVGAPNRVEQLAEALAERDAWPLIARGLGRSYGDSALIAGGTVLVQTPLDCMIAFDDETGVLECEAGVSLRAIIDTFLPRGWFLPTTPGTKFVTLGGAVAADVHGKNHHADGTIGRFVESMSVLVPSGEVIACSPHREAELFWATVGGMGLTGFITSLRLRLMKVESAYFGVNYRRTQSLDETLEQFEATNADYRYSVAWIDGLARGASLGRSVLMLANDGRVEALPLALRSRPLHVPSRAAKAVPFDFPNFALNSLTVRAFNELYYRAHPDALKWVDYDSFFYPLDGVSGWNRIYGRRGFVQYQALFPRDTARAGLVEVLEATAESGRASFLAVLKACGPRGEGVLSYPHEGFTLALDFPHTGDDLVAFTRRLDGILLRHGGRLYLAKDALMTRETFDVMYPEAERFREIKARVDPEAKLQSSQARRVGLVPS